MIRKTNFTSLLLLLTCAIATAQTYEWGGRFGGEGEDVVLAMHADAAGNVYTTGYFTDIADFDISTNSSTLSTGTFYECFVQKTGPDGTFIWAKKLGGQSGDNGTDITTDAEGNVYITGVFQETADFDPGESEYLLTSSGGLDIFIVKLNPNGNFLWAKSLSGSEYEESNGIGTDSSGNVYVSGYFYNALDFNPGTAEFLMSPTGFGDGFVMKLTSGGEFLWAKKFGGEDFDLATGLKVMPNGDVYVSGNFSLTADFDPSDTGIFTLTADENFSGIFLLHLKGDGAFTKAVKVGQAINEAYGYSVDVDGSGAAYITGFFGGAASFTTQAGIVTMTPTDFYNSYVAKINPDGTVAWAKQLASNMLSLSYGIAVNSLNEVVVSGYFNGTLSLGSLTLTEDGSNDSESYVTQLDADGNFMWARRFGGINFVDRSAIAIGGNDDIYLASAFETTVDINPDAGQEVMVTTAGFRDNFLIKLGSPILSSPQHPAGNMVSIYPNPAEQFINITSAETLSGKPFTIYDMAGRQVLKGVINGSTIDVTPLQSGIYNVILEGTAYRIVKE